MFPVIDRYFLAEIFRVFFAILSAVLLIVASILFLRTLEQVNTGALSAELVLRFLGLQLARDLASLLPPVFFIALLVALGRMAKDSELIALSACGLGPRHLYRAIFYAALPLVLLTAWLSLDLTPSVVKEIMQLRDLQKDQVYQIAGLKPGRFYQHENGTITVYIHEIDRTGELRHIFLHDQRGEKRKLIISQRGLLTRDPKTGDQFVTLIEGRRYDGNPGQADYAIGTFDQYRLRIQPNRATGFYSLKRATYPTISLFGSEDRKDLGELQHRLASPLAILTLSLLAVPLTTRSPRQRGGWRLLLAFLTYFSFFNLERVARSWYEIGFTPSWLGSLWYQGFLLVLVAVLLIPIPWQRWKYGLLHRLRPRLTT